MSQQNNLDYPAIQAQIEKQLIREKQIWQLFFFVMSLALYAIFVVVGWALFLGNGGQVPAMNIPGMARAANPLGDAMMLLSVAGLIPLLLQGSNLIMMTKRGERQLRDRIAGRIMQEALKKNYEEATLVSEKPKRAITLSEEGEFEDVVEALPTVETHHRVVDKR